MAKITSEFHFYMYRLREIYKQNIKSDTFDLSLLTIYEKFLRRYDDENIEISEFYFEHIQEFPDKISNIRYAVVLLIIIDLIGYEKAISIDFAIIEGIVSAFIEMKVNPYNFSAYLDVFMNDDLLDKLSYLWYIARIPLSNYFINIIKKFDADTLASYYWQTCVLRYICNITGTNFSPILKGSQSIKRIKQILEKEMRAINSEEFDGTSLNLLDKIDRNFTDEQKDPLVKRLRAIENSCTSREKAISLMLKTIKDFYKEQTINTISFSPIKIYKI